MGAIYFYFPYELLNSYSITHEISIFNNGICYPFSMKFNLDSEKLIVFLPGAFNRSIFNEVKFQRSSYFSSLEHNCISFFDPTLFLSNDIGIGWFQGEKEKDYIFFIREILDQIIQEKGIMTEDIIFFGTSAGGIPAFRLASFFTNSIVYAGNIQTDFLKYYKGARDKVIKYTYLDETIGEISSKYSNRSNIFGIDDKFKVIYTQNIADDFHFKNHYQPYFQTIGEKEKITFEIFEYNDDSKGHSPLGRERELMIIENILESKSIKKIATKLGLICVN